MPMASVTANPRTGPDPNWNRITAAINVVTLASMIVRSACRKPISTAETGVRPLRVSSRMRSNTSTLASTAMPIVSTMPAMPGNVRVACKAESAATINAMFTESATVAATPNNP